MAGNLAGKVALVTGASSGIGEATAFALGQAGASVAIAARRADRLESLAKRIEEAGGRALCLAGDAADETFATGIVDRTVKHFGRLDILVNSAGILQAGGIENSDIAEYRRVIDVNLMATYYTCKAAIAPMREQGSGDIINISSLAGRKVAPVFSAYSASKFALNAMTDGLRQEVGGLGIRVCVLMPGATATEVADHMTDPNFRTAMQAHVGKEGAVQSQDVGETVLFMVSLPRRANISEISIRPTIDVSP